MNEIAVTALLQCLVSAPVLDQCSMIREGAFAEKLAASLV